MWKALEGRRRVLKDYFIAWIALGKEYTKGLLGLCSSVVARKQLLYLGKTFDFRAKVPSYRWENYEHCYDEMWMNRKVMHCLVFGEAQL